MDSLSIEPLHSTLCPSSTSIHFISKFHLQTFQDNTSSGVDVIVENPLRQGLHPIFDRGRDDCRGALEDKRNFVKLLKLLRQEFDRRDLLLTAAVAAAKGQIDRAYDVKAVSDNLDLISVMTYDYHGWFPGHNYVGHHSPLFALPEEMSRHHPGHNLNTNFSLEYWIQLGADPSKLLLGLTTYGRVFTLSNETNNSFYAKAIAPGRGGSTAGNGVLAFGEFCQWLHQKGELHKWTVHRDPHAVSPYAVRGTQWFGYDDPESARVKAAYARTRGLAGVMVWAVDTDDFRGVCGQGKSPIAAAVQKGLTNVQEKWTEL